MAFVTCVNCNAQFYVKPSHLLRGWGKYCSIACRTKAQFNGNIVQCFICKKEVYRSQLAVKRSKSGKYFCSKKCQTIWRNKILFTGENHSNWKDGESAYRRILESTKREQLCNLCKIDDKRVLIVHHLDRNRKNNKVTNLIWLCNNCHYLVHHYSEEQRRLNIMLNR